MLIHWTAISDLGDSYLLIPLAMCALVWLLAGQAWKLARLWASFVVIDIVLVVATKLVVVLLHPDIVSIVNNEQIVAPPPLRFHGISGHAALSALIIPGLLFMLLHNAPKLERTAAVLTGVLMSLAVTCARVAVMAHSPIEVISGFLCGATLLWWMLRAMRQTAAPRLHPFWLIICMAPLAISHYGEPSQLELRMLRVVRHMVLQNDGRTASRDH